MQKYCNMPQQSQPLTTLQPSPSNKRKSECHKTIHNHCFDVDIESHICYSNQYTLPPVFDLRHTLYKGML